MTSWQLYAKAIAGAIVAGLTAAATALSDGAITPVEWITVAIALITALGVIWAVPNAPAETQSPSALPSADSYVGKHREM